MSVYVHPTAIVDDGAEIGNGTKVWHWSHISSKAKIGENCSFGQNVFVADNVIIGNNVKVQNNVSIYDGVIIEDDVFCGPSVVFTNVINPRSMVNRKSEFKKTLIKKGATLGANSTIVCGNNVGRYSFIGAGAVITTDTRDYSLFVGVPGKQIAWIDQLGNKIDLPLQSKCTLVYDSHDTKYVLNDNILEASFD